jgi:N-acetylglucosaminyldiphosphoundecaprenol N-acetyl-beta-D-mannosaminyltransferase
MNDNSTTTPTRYTLLGVDCDAVTIPEVLKSFEYAISTDQPNFIIGNHNLHSIYLFHRESRMQQFYDLCNVIYIDSMFLIFLGKLLGFPFERKHRTAFLDWYKDFLSLTEARDWKIFYVGGRQQSLGKAAEWFCSHYPKLSIRFHHGFFTSGQLPALYDEIREFRPHILLVGMGMPRQEDWILSALGNVRTNAIVNGGAMIEYLMGDLIATPRWLGQLGLEWMFRLVMEPRRLARRYLIEPLYLLDLLARDLVTAWNWRGVQAQARRFRNPGR